MLRRARLCVVLTLPCGRAGPFRPRKLAASFALRASAAKSPSLLRRKGSPDIGFCRPITVTQTAEMTRIAYGETQQTDQLAKAGLSLYID